MNWEDTTNLLFHWPTTISVWAENWMWALTILMQEEQHFLFALMILPSCGCRENDTLS
jgi:hypothetical protein